MSVNCNLIRVMVKRSKILYFSHTHIQIPNLRFILTQKIPLTGNSLFSTMEIISIIQKTLTGIHG